MANERRLIDANKLREDWLLYGANENIYSTNDVLDSIDEAPTVDAVEVVRCSQCIYSRELDRSDPMENRYVEGCLWCEYHCTGELPDEYCSDGERRYE